jgi:hypothetical protein
MRATAQEIHCDGRLRSKPFEVPSVILFKKKWPFFCENQPSVFQEVFSLLRALGDW